MTEDPKESRFAQPVASVLKVTSGGARERTETADLWRERGVAQPLAGLTEWLDGFEVATGAELDRRRRGIKLADAKRALRESRKARENLGAAVDALGEE